MTMADLLFHFLRRRFDSQ